MTDMQENNKNQINKETAIGEILEKCPRAAEILLSFGVHCVGCHVSPFEPLEEGFKGHGLGDDEINKAVELINEEIAKNSKISDFENQDSSASGSSESSLIVTDKAAEKLKELCSAHGKYALRIRVLPGGCSGYKYGMDLVDAKEESEQELTNNGVKIVISQSSLEKIAGAEIDYVDSLQGAGFKISNPKAKSTCGCGDSFN